MKKYLLFYCLAGVLFMGCSKDDGPVPEAVAIERIPAPLVKMDAGSSPAIDLLNQAAFEGKFTVGLYFSNDVPPSKFDIVIRKNNDNTNVKVFKDAVTNFPASFTLTTAELAALFGVPVALNDNFDIGVDVLTKSGKKYPAFPLVGVGYAAAFQPDHPGFNVSIRYSAICAYGPTLFGALGSTSTFDVLTDEWGDDPVNGWGPPAGYRPTVAVTVIDGTHLSFKSPVNGTSVIVLTINPLNNNISFTGQPYGDLSVGPLQKDPSWIYGQATIENSGVNVVLPCTKQIRLGITYRVSAGTFSNGGIGYTLLLKQQ